MEAEASFHEVSGINVSLDTDLVKEGGVNEYSHKLPLRTKYDNLSLKRGLLRGSSLLQWIDDALINFEFSPKLIEVSLLNSAAQPLVVWSFVNAYPVALKTTELKSQDNSLVVETLEIAYSLFYRMDV